jgi:hypothetical protein
MGCDIHPHIEFHRGTDDQGKELWWEFCEPYLGRNYNLFGLMAGVRGFQKAIFEPRGVPENISWGVVDDYTLFITDDPKCMDHPGFCSLDDLRRWNGRLWNEHRAIHPDWHTPSWLTTYEFAQVVEQYNQILKEAHPLAQATLDLMQSLDRSGLKARLVFWFDN